MKSRQRLQWHSLDSHFLILFLKIRRLLALLISEGFMFHTFEAKILNEFRLK